MFIFIILCKNGGHFEKTQRNTHRGSFYEIFVAIFRLSTKFGIKKTAFRVEIRKKVQICPTLTLGTNLAVKSAIEYVTSEC